MDNKVRRTLAAVISAAMVASAACVPSFASGSKPADASTSTPATAARTAVPQSENAVAKIGNNSYDSLQGAITKASPGDTIQVLKDVTESVSVSKRITLTSADPANPATIKGTITFGAYSDGSEVTGLNFILGEQAKVEKSIIVLGAKNVQIYKNTFFIQDQDTDQSLQYTSIWLEQGTTESTVISDNIFNLSNCPAESEDTNSNVAIALQHLGAESFPKDVTISGNKFNSEAIQGQANAIGVMVMGAAGELKIDSNDFLETVQDGGNSNFTNVILGGDVDNAQITSNKFAGYIGVELYRQKWGETISKKGNKATIDRNTFANQYGILVAPNGKLQPIEKPEDVTINTNTFAPGTKEDIHYNKGVEESSKPTVQSNVREVSTYSELTNALSQITAGTTIQLTANIECNGPITIEGDDITIDGQGKSLSLANKLESGAFITAFGENVTLKNLTVNTKGMAKHGIEYYQAADDGTIDEVTVNGGSYTSIQANGAKNLTIKNCTTKPNKGAYANIEYAMGEDVKTVPFVKISNVDWDQSYPLVYMDQDTINRVKNNTEDLSGASDAQVQQYIQKQIMLTGESYVWKWDDTNKIFVAVTSPTPPSGGGSSSSKPLESISLNATTAQVAPDGTAQLEISYTPSDTTASKSITWTSSDEKVATVDKNGKVTAVSKAGGTATITAKVGDKTATCTVVVNPFTLQITDLDGKTTDCAADGSTVIQIPQSAAYTFNIASGAAIDSFSYNAGNGQVGGTNTIAKWNGTSGTYQAYAAGKVGEKTGMYVNGVKLFTLEVTARPFTSDTTLTTPVQVGHPYTFRITLNDPKADFTFLTANGTALSTSYQKNSYPDKKGDYYCTITANKAVGDVGVYVKVAGKTYKVFAARCIA